MAPVISCEASFNFTGLDVEHFGSFAIGVENGVDLKVDVGGVYNLYPSIHSKRWFMSNHVSLNGVLGHFHLYSNKDYTHYGVAVNDKTCFSKLIDFFVLNKDLVQDLELKSFLLVKPHIRYIANLFFTY